MAKQYQVVAQYPKSKGDGYWTVKVDEEGNLSCDCPSWLYGIKRTGARGCKHTEQAEAEMALASSPDREETKVEVVNREYRTFAEFMEEGC
jgi:predicted nucleic acid-binding Zn finger protein